MSRSIIIEGGYVSVIYRLGRLLITRAWFLQEAQAYEAAQAAAAAQGVASATIAESSSAMAVDSQVAAAPSSSDAMDVDSAPASSTRKRGAEDEEQHQPRDGPAGAKKAKTEAAAPAPKR